jgi:hypothetical protein
VYIGHHHPELRPRISSFLVEMLAREDEDLEPTTFLALEAVCVDDMVVRAAIHSALERDAVDDSLFAGVTKTGRDLNGVVPRGAPRCRGP